MRYARRAMMLFLVFALAVAFSGIAMAAVKCPLCGMNMAGNENTAYEVTMADGKKVTYCCPHCGLWAQAKEKVKSARARDFISGEWMNPHKMVFLANSTAIPACSPSWIAFGSKSDAEKFQKGFGGTIYSFDEALKERVKQPMGMK